MNRLLLLCLLVSFQAQGKGLPPFNFPYPNTLSVSPTIADTIPPTIECPPSDTIQLGVGQCDTMYSYTIIADDDQPNFILIQLNGLASGSSFQLGTTVNSFLVTDLSGNTATCSFTVTVLGAGSTLACDNFVEIELGANCTTTIQPEQILLPPFGCTGDDEVQIDRTPPFGNGPWVPGILFQTDLGKTYAIRVVDQPTGNMCWGNISVVDVAPTLTCTDITVHCVVENFEPGFLKDSLGLANVFPVVSDNCPGVTTDFVDFQQNLPCNPNNNLNGTVTRVWTATDISGNTATCQQVIGLVRSLAGIEFPAGDTVSCTEKLNFDLLGAPVLKIGNQEFSLWPASACDFEVQFDDATLINYCGGGSKVSRTWSVIDICQPSNTVTGVQIIDFVDENGPALTCDSSITVVADATDCLITFDIPDVSFSDDCSQVNSVVAIWDVADTQDTLAGTLSVPATQASFVAVANFPAGISTLTYLAKDECGNTGTCQTIVTVWDTDPPIADCITFFTVVLGENGEFALGADTLDLNSRDSCNQQLYFKMRRATPSPSCFSSDQFDDVVLFCCSDIGDTIELTRRVYDVEVPEGPVAPDFAPGQFSDCVVKIEVLDTLPLLCVAPPDVVVNCVDFDPQFSDYGMPVFNCSVDSSAVNADFSQFDSTCLEGKVLRTFQVFDKNGNSAACSQQITVEHVQDYFIKFPDDVIVTACNGSNNFGEPEFFQNGCEDLAFSFEDEIFTVVPDACYKIERTWKIWNKCTYDSTASLIGIPNPNPHATSNHPDNLPGPIVSAPGTDSLWTSTIVQLNPDAPAATDFSTYWAADANAYVYKQVIKVIDTEDPVVNACPTAALPIGDTTANDELLWNQTYWLDPVTNQNDLCESETALSITASDACSGENLNVNYLLFLNTDGDAIQETVIKSDNPPAPGTVNFNNFSTPNYAGGTPRVFDGRPVSPNEVYRWALHESVDSNQRTVSVQWKTLAQMPTPGNPNGLPGVAPQLPHGTHKIRWIVSDACGNETTCEYSFTINDSKAPAVNCLQGLTVEIPVSGSVELSDTDFLQSNEDNCTPAQQLKRAIRLAGAGTGFPEDANGNPQTKITFDCGDLGQQSVELWAKDLADNATFCTADIVVADADSSCNSKLTVAGNVVVDNTTLQLSATNPFAAPVMLTQQADDQGNFQFTQAIFSGSDYMLTPTNDQNHLNGVSTFDLVLITRHILGLEPLDTPYKIISADANRNNSVTTFDIVEIRKLILGIYTEFPNNTSWRFVDADYVFPDPANPFLFTFPEKITRTVVISDQLEDDFIPAKIGDVNNSATLDNFSAPNDRSSSTLFFDLQNRVVQAGEEFTVRFKSAEPTLGYQFTLNTGGLEILNILPCEGLDAGNFAIFEDAITTSVENGAGEFAIVFRASVSGKLSEMLSISSRITRAEAYKTDQKMAEVALRFDDGAVSQPGFELFQNQPNPFRDRTIIGFYLPKNADATLTIFDETGRVLFTQSGHYARGYNAVFVENTLLGNAGVFYYKLQTEKESAVRKMVLIK
ncbi:MAG: hypothetical protein OHK0019_33650 [Saprospiraceae bacterium]